MDALLDRLSQNSSFQGLLQTTWDNTSMAALKVCPRYYFYTIMHGYRPREEALDLVFGLHYHAAIEAYDKALARGVLHEDAIRESVRLVLRLTWHDGRPWRTCDTNKNRWTLVRLVVWYLDERPQQELTKTIILQDGRPAVELSFAVELDYLTPSGMPYRYAGHCDRLVDFQGEAWINDHKTTKKDLNQFYFRQFTPGGQFSGYTFGATVAWHLPVKGVIVEAAQTLPDRANFHRSPVMRSEAQLDEWYRDLGLRLQEAERYAEERHWPMNEESCGRYQSWSKGSGGCPFRDICSRNPASRGPWLEQGFERRVWDPLKVRGEA